MNHKRVRKRLLAPTVGFIFFVLLVGLLVTIFLWGDPYLWPFVELGRRTSFLLGCGTLACIPIAWGLGVVYAYVFSVVLGAVVQMVLTEQSSMQ